jgi:hypothetical protein
VLCPDVLPAPSDDCDGQAPVHRAFPGQQPEAGSMASARQSRHARHLRLHGSLSSGPPPKAVTVSPLPLVDDIPLPTLTNREPAEAHRSHDPEAAASAATNVQLVPGGSRPASKPRRQQSPYSDENMTLASNCTEQLVFDVSSGQECVLSVPAVMLSGGVDGEAGKGSGNSPSAAMQLQRRQSQRQLTAAAATTQGEERRRRPPSESPYMQLDMPPVRRVGSSSAKPALAAPPAVRPSTTSSPRVTILAGGGQKKMLSPSCLREQHFGGTSASVGGGSGSTRAELAIADMQAMFERSSLHRSAGTEVVVTGGAAEQRWPTTSTPPPPPPPHRSFPSKPQNQQTRATTTTTLVPTTMSIAHGVSEMEILRHQASESSAAPPQAATAASAAPRPSQCATPPKPFPPSPPRVWWLLLQRQHRRRRATPCQLTPLPADPPALIMACGGGGAVAQVAVAQVAIDAGLPGAGSESAPSLGLSSPLPCSASLRVHALHAAGAGARAQREASARADAGCRECCVLCCRCSSSSSGSAIQPATHPPRCSLLPGPSACPHVR